MKEYTMPACGNLRDQMIRRRIKMYTELLSKEWKGKAIWEHIRDKELTAVPHLIGYNYFETSPKIMVVGRAVNGWQVPFSDCTSLEKTVDSILLQKNRLDDFAQDYTIDEKTGGKYYYAKSPFLRMMRLLVGRLTGSEENWQQRILWSNLLKVAPRDGGNPSWLMVRNELTTYINILRNEILENTPDIVVFVTDMDFFDHYPNDSRYASFYELMEENSGPANLPEYICAAGRFVDDPKIKMIVCKRPEGRAAKTLIDNIYKTYTEIE